MRSKLLQNSECLFASLVLLATPLSAQWGGEATRQAEIRGGGGDRGKCTIEVEVDGVAEVEVRGDSGRIRTISGQPAAWRRFVCNQRMPTSPNEFRFRGIDGRGRQNLVSEPGGRRAAVVRIEDPKGGREGYTFDLEWRGGADSGGGGGGWGDRGWRAGDGAWNNEVRYRGRGDGYVRIRRGEDDPIRNCQVEITRSGDVSVGVETERNTRLALRGRVTRVDRDRLYADLSGDGRRGTMIFTVAGGNRLREMSMDGSGRERFELRWRD